MKRLFSFAALFVVAGLVGCSSSDPDPGGVIHLGELPTNSKADPKDKEAVVHGNNTFAFDLYREIRKTQKGNFVYSPFSISTALAMTYAGARNETAKEMEAALRLPFGGKRVHPPFAAIIHDLFNTAKKHKYEMIVANALWGKKGFEFETEFTANLKANYGAPLNEVDFTDPQAASDRINKWVAKNTKKRIPSIVGPGAITPLTRLILTNAVFFKGRWENVFDKDDTKDRDFHVTTQKTIKTPMMFQKEWFRYGTIPNGKIIELPYLGRGMSMFVLLPSRDKGLDPLEKSIAADDLEKWIGEMRRQHVKVHLPRFKMASNLELDESLKLMGMQKPFSKDAADFAGITKAEELYIDGVLHKATIETTEEGTVAAAVTTVEMEKSKEASEEFVFNADRPFLFVIRENTSGSILFAGRVVNPKE